MPRRKWPERDRGVAREILDAPVRVRVGGPLVREAHADRLARGHCRVRQGQRHTQVQTTARYAHLARDSIQNAAARITGSIGGDLTP